VSDLSVADESDLTTNLLINNSIDSNDDVLVFSVNTEESRDLTKALERIKNIIRQVNNAARICQNVQKLQDLQLKLDHKSVDYMGLTEMHDLKVCSNNYLIV